MKTKHYLWLILSFLFLAVGQVWGTSPETYTFSSFESDDAVVLTDLTGFTITLNKGTASSKPAWSSSQARIYAGGNLVVESSTYTITKIVYTYAVNTGGKNKVAPTISGVSGNTNSGSWDVDNKTWTGSDNKVTFSTTGSAGNLGFTKLVITYTTSGGGPEEPTVFPTPTIPPFHQVMFCLIMSMFTRASRSAHLFHLFC